jgi:hypothetical protein
LVSLTSISLGKSDTNAFKQLSFYRPGLNFKNIFYGNWQYDTLHLRVTKYVDEFGDAVDGYRHHAP